VEEKRKRKQRRRTNRGEKKRKKSQNQGRNRTRGKREEKDRGDWKQRGRKKTGREGRKQRRQNRGSVSTISSPSSTTLQPPGTQTGEEPPSTWLGKTQSYRIESGEAYEKNRGEQASIQPTTPNIFITIVDVLRRGNTEGRPRKAVDKSHHQRHHRFHCLQKQQLQSSIFSSHCYYGLRRNEQTLRGWLKKASTGRGMKKTMRGW